MRSALPSYLKEQTSAILLGSCEKCQAGTFATLDTAKPSPRQTTEIKHASTRCDLEIKHVGVSGIEAHASLWLHDEDIAFK